MSQLQQKLHDKIRQLLSKMVAFNTSLVFWGSLGSIPLEHMMVKILGQPYPGHIIVMLNHQWPPLGQPFDSVINHYIQHLDVDSIIECGLLHKEVIQQDLAFTTSDPKAITGNKHYCGYLSAIHCHTYSFCLLSCLGQSSSHWRRNRKCDILQGASACSVSVLFRPDITFDITQQLYVMSSCLKMDSTNLSCLMNSLHQCHA